MTKRSTNPLRTLHLADLAHVQGGGMSAFNQAETLSAFNQAETLAFKEVKETLYKGTLSP
jgi:hypothetical protein